MLHEAAELKKSLRGLRVDPAPEPAGRRAGAVLLVFMDTSDGPGLLFTKRAANLEEHPGQISFPGGAVEPEDRDFLAAALRETREEVGLASEELEVLSALPSQPVLDRWLIHPFTAWWTAPRPLAPDPVEVDHVIIATLSELRAQHQPGCWRNPDPTVCRYLISGETLWGATARITARLLDQG